MKTSQAGVDLIKQFEGLELTAYPDPGTGGEPWTIGYGHTGGVKPGDTVTEAEAEEILRQDLARFEDCVNAYVSVPITQSEFDALVSFAFNVGCGALKSSTLLRLLNGGDHEAAAQQFPRWNKAAGRVMAGLTRRREAERDLFVKEIA